MPGALLQMVHFHGCRRVLSGPLQVPMPQGRLSFSPLWCSGGVYFPSLIILSLCSRIFFNR